MKVLVTGHQGYIGAHLVDVLNAAGHSVTGCDIGLFEGCEWRGTAKPDAELKMDVRHIQSTDIEGHDCVMHLAALSNDPMGDVDAELTYAINRDASVRLAELSKQVGVSRFLFASSCSLYGKGEKLDLSEDDLVNPLTPYAKSKIDSECAIQELADHEFSPVFLRNATAFGDSPMFRIDLVANNLLASAMAYGEIRIQSDGSPWRPLIHCRDIARAFLAFANAPREAVHGKAVNVGGNSANYQVRDIAEQVGKLIRGVDIVYTGEVGHDPRSYRVRFDLLERLLPDFRLQYDLASGLEEMYLRMKENGFGAEDFEGDRFVRLRVLKRNLSKLEDV